MKFFRFTNYQQFLTATLVSTTTIIFTAHTAFAQVLRGAGDGFVQPLLERYRQEYESQTGEKFKYTAVGSGGGIRFFINDSVEFAATTLIPTPIEINQMEDGLLMLPTGGSSVAIVYNLKEVSSTVKLSRDQLGKIFTGEITNWQQINPKFPNQKIQVVTCAKNCSTSFILTKYLQKITGGKILPSQNPEWKFPVFSALTEDSAIAGEVSRTEGAIGYVQTSIALQENLSIASLENKAGNYLQPTVETTEKALANVKFNNDFTTEDIQDPENGYPLVSLTWLLLPKNYDDQKILEKTQSLVTWIFTQGQKLNPELGYTKVPDDVNKKAIVAINNQFKISSMAAISGDDLRLSPIGNLYDNTPSDVQPIVNVNQLIDIDPQHWAYSALSNLVEKHQCLSGTSQNTFTGNRTLKRHEFAFMLNSCLLKIRRSLDSLQTNKLANKQDLAVVQRLQTEFTQELQNITNRVDNLEEKTALIRDQQFSTTTVLRGRVDFNLISGFGDKKAVAPGANSTEKLTVNPTFSGRASLTLDTSFTGKDKLQTQLVAGNINNLNSAITGTDMTLLIGATNTNNNVRLGTIFYQFPIGDKGIIAIAPVADFPTRIFPALNPVSSISNFGAESPIYSFAFGSGAVGYYQFTDQLAAGISYLTTSGNDPNEGLFGGQYTLLSQVTYTPSDKLGIAFTYGNYYASKPGSTINVTGSKGSQFAQLPFGENTPTSSNAFGLQLTYKLSNKLVLGGWTSYFKTENKAIASLNGIDFNPGANADIWSWAVTASLTDLGKLGSQLSFVFGMPPKVTSNDIMQRRDRDTSLHWELSYRYPLTERIDLTPGFLMITNPEHNAANDTIWVGLIRTSFKF
ncbi:iron uptake porin [Anabaena sp. UHCC 0451]|uniref:iron uptake porin n=1 Tax=Anabaena sp. UHCC 0451 TaxID=2055235 RepID=UPI002B20630B|nr:iron uptake porin [Anabaena sp. UHCC 0451]MEA5579018.1 iron uptake porin [Anabaena sp. UHCC 0451]